MRPFSFLAGIESVMDGTTLAAEARRAEAMGFDALVVPDHLIQQLSPIPALATIAAATEHLRIAAFVHNNDLRHPAVLAPGPRQPGCAERRSTGRGHRSRLEQAGVRLDRLAV
jgi:hypothetical protein